MNFTNIRPHIGSCVRGILCLSILTTPLVGCESIYEGEGDCSRVYQVSFTHTMNIQELDAFGTKVNSLSLFLFDENGLFVTSKTETGDLLKADNYVMSFEDVDPGTYDLVAWGGLNDGNSFELAQGDKPVTKDDLICRLNRKTDEQGVSYSGSRLNDLFHAMEENVEFPARYGTTRVTSLDLTKNTNTVRIVLHNNSGGVLDENKFHFTITDNNGVMNYDNALLDDEYIDYREHIKRTEMLANPESRRSGEDDIKCLVAEINMARLVVGQNAVVRIEADGKDVPIVSLPLINLLLVAKGEANRPMDSQEYLDRQDDYTLFFSIDDQDEWYINAGIFVNGWKMIFQDADM